MISPAGIILEQLRHPGQKVVVPSRQTDDEMTLSLPREDRAAKSWFIESTYKE